MINFACKKCGEIMEAPEDMKGQPLACPRCKINQKVPGELPVPPVSAPAQPQQPMPVTIAKQKNYDIPGVPFLFALFSLLWLGASLLLFYHRMTAPGEGNILHELFILLSAGFSWLGLIGSTILWRLCRM